MKPTDILPSGSPEEIVKDYVREFTDIIILRLKLSFAALVGLVVFFGTAIAGSLLFGEYLYGAIPGFVLFGVTMWGIMKLLT